MQAIASAAMRGARVGKVVAFTGDSGSKSAKVKFSIKQKIHFGQHIAVVGSKPVLGEWNPKNSLELRWQEGDIWSAEANIDPQEPVDFKFVIVENEDEIKWQAGDNVVLSVPEDAEEILVEAGSFESTKEIVIKPIKTEAKVAEKKVAEKILEKNEKTTTISSVAAPDVARSNIMRKASTPTSTTAPTAAKAAAQSSISSAATPLSLAEIEKLTLPKIKAIMVKMGLETTGKKADLIARIRSYMQT
jgi:Starch binding domain/SAP domain